MNKHLDVGRLIGYTLAALDSTAAAAVKAAVAPALPMMAPPFGPPATAAKTAAQLAAAVIASRGIAVTPAEAVAIHAEVSAELERGHHE